MASKKKKARNPSKATAKAAKSKSAVPKSTARAVSKGATLNSRQSRAATSAKVPVKAKSAAKAAASEVRTSGVKKASAKSAAKAAEAARKLGAAKAAEKAKAAKARELAAAAAKHAAAKAKAGVKDVSKPVVGKPASTPPAPASKTLARDAVMAKQPEKAADVAAARPSHASAPTKPLVASHAPKTEPKPPVVAKVGQRAGFRANEFIVYPAHGVGQIVAIEEQEVAGFKLELFVISFAKDKMTLKVPAPKAMAGAIRKLSEPETVGRSLEILMGRARVKRTMWSRRAQEYEAKINSGDLGFIAEVVRDLFRSEAQPEQSYSERQLYEAALDRMAREIAAVRRLTETEALKQIETHLLKGPRRGAKSEPAEGAGEAGMEQAAA